MICIFQSISQKLAMSEELTNPISNSDEATETTPCDVVTSTSTNSEIDEAAPTDEEVTKDTSVDENSVDISEITPVIAENHDNDDDEQVEIDLLNSELSLDIGESEPSQGPVIESPLSETKTTESESTNVSTTEVGTLIEEQSHSKTDLINQTDLCTEETQLPKLIDDSLTISKPPEDLDLNKVPSSSSTDKDSPPSIYQVKRIKFDNNPVSIITQNENGPCPLLAIINWLSLRGKVKIPTSSEIITSEQLMEYLGDCVFNQVPQNITEDSRLNFEQNVNDAMSIFHKLQTGLDVNVKFTGIGDFEYTPECIIFDLLNISIYHGWLVDPESKETAAAVGQCSYNQLVEKIISEKTSCNADTVTETLLAEQFLERTAAQLTYHGLCELNSGVAENELCVLFRNNHFSTLYKHKNELFLLVTDQGFLREPSVVWETLLNVEGDGNFVNAEFKTYRKPEPLAPPSDIILNSEQQINQDYLIACSLAQDEPEPELTTDRTSSSSPPVPASRSVSGGMAAVQCLSDHDLAVQLQNEENQAAAAAAAPQSSTAQGGAGAGAVGGAPEAAAPAPTRVKPPSGGSKKKDDCVVL